MQNLNVLVVDDHDVQRGAAAAVLRELGVRVILEAADGRAAYEAIRSSEERVDVVICDLMMDGMDGMELLRHLATAGATCSIILASAMQAGVVRSAEAMARERGLRVLGRLDKPLSRDRLAELLRSAEAPRAPAGTTSAPAAMPIDAIREGLSAGQMTFWYQPKVDLVHGGLVGVEALARWQHPREGVLSPARFIPPMERAGLIGAFTEVMMPEAVAAARRFLDHGLRLGVAFNASARWLHDTTIPARLRDLAAAHGVPHELLILEVTETAVTDDAPGMLETLSRLRMYGFGLSIDDFGTGYSSIQQLSRIPFTELKLDRSFVSGCDGSPTNRSILRSMISLARDLGLKTVGEGVETDAERAVLLELGCDVEQGYRVSKPLPEDALRRWAAARSAAA